MFGIWAGEPGAFVFFLGILSAASGRTSAKGCHPLGLEPDDLLAAAPPAGHFVAGLVLGDGNQMGFRAQTGAQSLQQGKCQLQAQISRSQVGSEGRPPCLPPPRAAPCDCYVGFSKVSPGPMMAFQSLGISVKD